MKAVNVKMLDVRGLTDVTDLVFVASGNSDRHVRSIAERVVEMAKAAGFRPIGVEGAREGEWVLVDLNDVVCHVMLPRTRELYGLEQLWDAPPPTADAGPVDTVPTDKRSARRAGRSSAAPSRTAAKRKRLPRGNTRH
jgi:ribosome-associated protein